MENTSQQTEDFFDETTSRKCCKRIWPYVCPIVVGLVFIGLALTFAIIYTGFGMRHKDYDFMLLHMNETPVHCIKRMNNPESLKLSNLVFTSIEMYPYVGSLVSIHPSVFLCAVVVINVRYVLTGANCFTTNFDSLHVKVGSKFWDKGNEYVVEKFLLNENYDGRSLDNNLALIKVSQNIIMNDDVQMTRLPTSTLNDAKKGVVVAWNLWVGAEQQHIKMVQQELDIWQDFRCKAFLGNRNTSKFICASLNNYLCNLDVTGPLIVNEKVVGFWSWGLSCLNVPSVFTNLYHYREWISKHSII